MNFSRFLDIQSWWEVPSIAYFCSLFRTAFNLLDFDIEELEEALLTDGPDHSGKSLLTELIVRLLKGSLGYHDISAFNYQMYLRRLFRKKCQSTGRYNPFNTDIDFQFLPLRSKVEILYALCDFRLDAEDVFDLFKNLEAESLRVEPLGWDDNDSAYWYFYGTRLYREDIKRPGKSKRKKSNRRRSWFYGDDYLQDTTTERVWQVVCFTEADWTNLTEKFKKATSKAEKELYRSLSINFLPEIPRLFQEKERQQRKRKVSVGTRRTSSRVQRIRQREEEEKPDVRAATQESTANAAEDPREVRARRRNLLRRSKSSDSDSSASERGPDAQTRPEPEEPYDPDHPYEPETDPGEGGDKEEMPQKSTKASKGKNKKSKSAAKKEPPPPPPPVRTGRKTNNSLACATGQIVIPDNDEPVNSTRRKIKTSQIFSQTEEDVQTDMYKVLEQLTNHEDAWPFMDPVEEEYAPNYYAVIRRPMDLHKMEERLDNGQYRDFAMFKADFKLIVNNCRLYNGQDNEYTTMVDNLQVEFERLTDKYIHRPSSSDEEIAVEYQLPTPSRKHKMKRDAASPARHQRKKRRIETIVSGDLVKMKPSERDRILASLNRDDDTDDMGVKVPDTEDEEVSQDQRKVSSQDVEMQSKNEEKSKEASGMQEVIEADDAPEAEEKKSKESHKHKDGKGKKKRKGHHRHGKHSKNHKKEHKSGKRKHSKKRGKKDSEGKRERRKKKKSKHQEEVLEPAVEEVKRSPSPESAESSNRSRSASPLPSIHTLSPSPEPEPIEEPPKVEPEPEPSDLLSDPEFLKDKYDKIKERRRNAAKDAFESLLEYKQKVAEKQKHNLDIPHKDKNQKLRETIEKLKAKNRKIGFSNMFTPGRSGLRRSKASHTKTSKDFKESDNDTSEKDEEEEKQDNDVEEEEVVVKKKKRKGGKRGRKSCAKNASASVALEQAVKDISKWLDDAPKGSALSSPSDSPAQTISTEDHDSRMDDESSQGERSLLSRRDASRKTQRVVKRREVQRTIDRLQPGKSKGNLLTNIAKSIEKFEEDQGSCSRDTIREESSPKLSLGSVLPTVEFTLGDDHKFGKNDEEKDVKMKSENKEDEKPVTKEHKVKSKGGRTPKPVESTKEVKDEQTSTEELPVVEAAVPHKKDVEVETEPQLNVNKPSQEKATPNLSAWFKAFGAPKSTPTAVSKKKADDTETEEKPAEQTNSHAKTVQNANKIDSPIDPGTPTADGGDSPLPAMNAARPRRTSTGSSVSERSSFSQDLDSPRHLMSHNSPLLRSPASPRTEDFQKITYPIINGSVRAGFYQDTTTTKSPDKSCSPREGPQSPYSPYSQHVYALNSGTTSGTPNYFVDQSKSPMSSYGQNAPYLDSSKVHMISKPPRAHEDYTGAGQQEGYQQHPYAPYSQSMSILPPPPPPPPPQQPPLPATTPTATLAPPTTPSPQPSQPVSDAKTALFPVKKRTYNEPEPTVTPANNAQSTETKDPVASPAKNEYQPPKQAAAHPPLPPLSVDDIALALSEKSEMAKISSLREKVGIDYTERNTPENLTNTEAVHETKKDTNNEDSNKSINLNKKDNIDMVNMGYMNTNETQEIDYSTRDVNKSNGNQLLRKGFEIEAVAINLGVSNSQAQRPMSKANINTTPNMTPAHSHETTIPRAPIHTELVNQNLAHVHHNQYDSLSSMQSISNFSLNDIELANKKLYAGNPAPTATAIDYGNWKMTNQMRNQDMMPSDYSTNYTTNNDDKKTEVSSPNPSAINYNKATLSQPQYSNYNSMSRSTLSRQQENQQSVPAELRIPNPRGLLKADSIIATSTLNDAQTIAKNMDTLPKSQKATEKAAASPNPYKTSYAPMSSLPMDTLRSLPNYPRMLERYRNDERYLSTYPTSSAMYHDKAYQMAELFNKTIPAPEAHSASASIAAYSQSGTPITKDSIVYKTSSTASQAESKPKSKRKRTTAESKPASSQAYHGSELLSVKQGMMQASAFNVGVGSMNMALSGMYADNSGYALVDDFRNTNQLMAANYMAAAVAHQRNETSAEKMVKPAHQNSGSFSFIGPQVRAGYPFTDPASPIYQQYLQRYQEELQRQTMGLYAPPYAPTLTIRQPYDAINRPTWL